MRRPTKTDPRRPESSGPPVLEKERSCGDGAGSLRGKIAEPMCISTAGRCV